MTGKGIRKRSMSETTQKPEKVRDRKQQNWKNADGQEAVAGIKIFIKCLLQFVLVIYVDAHFISDLILFSFCLSFRSASFSSELLTSFCMFSFFS